MYYLDENMVQVWEEETYNRIILLNHNWRNKQDIVTKGFKLFFQEVTKEQLYLLKTLKDINNKEDYEEIIGRLGHRLFHKLVKYKYLTDVSTEPLNQSVWHSQAGEYLNKYLKAMYHIDYPERPSRILLLPTLRCSGNCIFCITNSKTKNNQKELDIETWKMITEKISKELHPCSVDIVGGEPLIRFNISLAIAEILVKHNILVKVITNGLALSNIDRVKELYNILANKKHNIQISLDGDEETHNLIRPGVKYDKVMQAIKNISQIGLTFGINLTINKYNLENVDCLIEKLYQYHPSYVLIGPLQISPKDIDLCSKIMITEEEEEVLRDRIAVLKDKYKDIIIKYDKEEEIYKKGTAALGNSKKHHTCTGFMEEMSIVPSGNIVSCLRGAAYPEFYGENIVDFQGGLRDLWLNSKISQIFRSIPVSGKCRECEYNQQCNMGCPLEAYVLDGNLGGYNPHCKYEP